MALPGRITSDPPTSEIELQVRFRWWEGEF